MGICILTNFNFHLSVHMFICMCRHVCVCVGMCVQTETMSQKPVTTIVPHSLLSELYYSASSNISQLNKPSLYTHYTFMLQVTF